MSLMDFNQLNDFLSTIRRVNSPCLFLCAMTYQNHIVSTVTILYHSRKTFWYYWNSYQFIVISCVSIKIIVKGST